MASSQDNTNFLTYTNTDLGFTIKYPSDWLVNESNTALGLKSPDGAGFVLVSTSNLPNGTSMSGEELAKTFISHQPFGFRPIEVNTNNYFLSGHPAARIIGIAGFGRPGEPGASQNTICYRVQSPKSR